jgi:hypothetical protein
MAVAYEDEVGDLAEATNKLRELLSGFTRRIGPGGVVFEHALDGSLAILEQVPLRPLRALIDEHLGDVRVRSIGPLQRLITIEGEHAGVATVVGASTRSTIAMVAGDDTCTVILGTTHEREHTAVREAVLLLARWTFLGLGGMCRRRYDHAVPLGWTGVARPHVTDWLCPTYPRQPSLIRVFHARRQVGGAVEELHRTLTMQNRSLTPDTGEPTAVVTRSGLRGLIREHVQPGARPMIVGEALLEDSRYVYAVHLETPRDCVTATLPAFLEVIHSIQPIPSAPSLASKSSPLAIWSE